MHDDRFEYGLLSYPGLENIGDDIQSLAAKAFLPRVDHLVARENLHAKPNTDRRVKIILNGFFMHAPRHWPPHEQFVPLLISLHMTDSERSPLRPWPHTVRDLMLGRRGLSYLNAHGPVGARDRATYELLRNRGVDTYLSSCLTLTLTAPEWDDADRNQIVACDLPDDVLDALKRRIGVTPRTVTHWIDPAATQPERESAAANLIAIYARARAVVTTRLHAALPCLALGTPALFIDTGRNAERIEPALEFAHHCTAPEFIQGAGFDPSNPPPNPLRHVHYADELRRRCREFIMAD